MKDLNEEENLKLLEEKLNRDLDILEKDEPNYLLELSKKISKWQSFYSRKLNLLKKTTIDADVKYCELYKYYQFEIDIKLDKKELSTFIHADVEYRKLRKAMNDLEIVLNFTEKAIKLLENQHWHLKTRLEYMKVLGYAE